MCECWIISPITPLFSGQFWNFSVSDPGNNCFHDISPDNVSSCTVYFSICKPLPSSICGTKYGNVSYCQVVTAKDTTVYKYDIGNYTVKHSFVALGMLNFLHFHRMCCIPCYQPVSKHC